MGFKYYEQNQLMIPMEWKTLIDKDDVVIVHIKVNVRKQKVIGK